MGRVSQAQAQRNRSQIVAAAARMFRERGVARVSVAEVMAEVGLTHGGFYRHFPTKDALVTEAVGQAFVEQTERLTGYDELAGRARAAFLDMYLSAEHRDDPGHGCATAGFSDDVARDEAADGAKQHYADGVEVYARWFGRDGEDLVAVSILVGALLLARATAGTDLSDRILTAAHAALSEPE